MDETDDIELLRQYAEEQSEAAFTALVKRHLNLVYSAARRSVDNVEQAEEITRSSSFWRGRLGICVTAPFSPAGSIKPRG
jgi:hypothetical protein